MGQEVPQRISRYRYNKNPLREPMFRRLTYKCSVDYMTRLSILHTHSLNLFNLHTLFIYLQYQIQS